MVESCRFKLPVSYDVQIAASGFKQVEIAYLARLGKTKSRIT